MQRSAATLCLTLTIALSEAPAANPNDYISAPRALPTPYGQRLVRASDDQALPSDSSVQQLEAELTAAIFSPDDYLASIATAEIAGGPYGPELLEPLAATGLAYATAGDHSRALDYFRRALHLSRINEGLYSTSQLPVLEGMIQSQLALGQIAAADEIQKYRYRVQQYVYAVDDPELLQATLDYTDWERQLYLAGLDGATYRRLLKIHSLHTSNIERLEAEDASQPALVPHLYQRLKAEYLLSDYQGEKEPHFQLSVSGGFQAGPAINTDLERQEFRMIKKNNFRNGRKTLEQVVGLLEGQEPQDIDEIARAKVALGDWYLWWDFRARALRTYEQAYALFAGDNNPLTDPQALFIEPVELPEDPLFRQGLVTPSVRSPAKARVSLTVTRLGRVEDIEILELEPEDSMGARVTLFGMLRQARFRPLIRNGEVIARTSVVRDYAFDY